MSCLKPIAIALVILMIFPVISVTGQQSSEQGAELSVIPAVHQLPLIVPNQQTTIPLRYTDNFGMNWTKLQYFYGNTGVRALLSFLVTRVIWPIIHPTWKPFLGYSSVNFDAEIIGNPPGWLASINPRNIAMSTDGTTANLSLNLFVNDLTAANTVTVRISATRILKDGSTYGTSFFEIPVRSAQLNYITVKPDSAVKEVAPSAMVTFMIDVTNLGYFVDTFAARITTDDNVIGTLSQQSIVLQPGETQTIRLQVMTPDIFFDPGTTHTITIKAYSVTYPTNQFTGQVQVMVKGFYISPLTWFVIGVVVFILLFIFILFRYLFGWRRYRSGGGKPDKPWTIPEEKAYLEELKAQDKEEYRKVLQMMEDEYRSALLWYEDYCRSIKPEQDREKRKRKILRLPFKKTTVPEEKQSVPEWKIVDESAHEQAIVEKKCAEIVEKETVPAQAERDKALEKIRREQEKQKKKLKQ
jgi:hypothetical protein